MSLKGSLKRFLLRPRGDLRRIRFGPGGKTTAFVPDDMIWNVCRELILCRIYEPDQAPLGPGLSVVIDAGAHVGVFSLLAADHARSVIAIEADPLNFRFLQANISLNKLEHVRPIHAALLDQDGVTLFQPSDYTGGGSAVQEDASGVPVPAISLDTLLRQHDRVDLLKLDIEGAELRALGSSSELHRVEAIVGELHFPHGSQEVEAIRSRLSRAGFEVHIVPERNMYQLDLLARAFANRRLLHGERWIKLLLVPYFLLRPLHRAGDPAAELPGLYAYRPTTTTCVRMTFKRAASIAR